MAKVYYSEQYREDTNPFQSTLRCANIHHQKSDKSGVSHTYHNMRATSKVYRLYSKTLAISVMDSHKNHNKEKPSFRWPSVEWMSGYNECCSAPCPHSFPACNLCERNTLAKHKTDAAQMITPAQQKRYTSSIGAWPNFLDQRLPKYCIVCISSVKKKKIPAVTSFC